MKKLAIAGSYLAAALIRRDLMPAPWAKLTAQREGAYQKAHPETGHGKAPVGRSGKKENAKFTFSFAADTAAKSGKSVRSVHLDVTRAKALGADLDRVAGTSLDKGSETVNVAGSASSA